MIRRFAIDVVVAVPAVFVACILWNAAIDSCLLYALWKDRRAP